MHTCIPTVWYIPKLTPAKRWPQLSLRLYRHFSPVLSTCSRDLSKLQKYASWSYATIYSHHVTSYYSLL